MTRVYFYTITRSPFQEDLFQNKNGSLEQDPACSCIPRAAQDREEISDILNYAVSSKFLKTTRMFSFSKSIHFEDLDMYFFFLDHLHSLAFPLQRIPLSHMTRTDINSLLVELGFYKKAQAEDEVPEEFRFSPAKDSPFKEHHKQAPTNHDLPEEPQPESAHKDL